MKKLYVFLLATTALIASSELSAQLYWSDGFNNYSTGTPLHNKGRWVVQNEADQGYMIQNTSPLVYAGLLSDANYTTGGYNYFPAGVSFPFEEGSLLYTNHVSDANPTLLGYKTGSSNVLWYSQLVRADNNDHIISNFHGRGGAFAWWVDQWNLGIMRNAGSHQWGIIINNDDRQFSNVTSEVGDVTLIVAKLMFEADGITISLYVNPTPGVEPTTPTISGKSTVITGICSIQQYMGFSADKYSLDEVRLGETYADVTPSVTSTKLTGTNDNNVIIRAEQGSIIADLTEVGKGSNLQVFNSKGMLLKNMTTKNENIVKVTNLNKGMYLVKISIGKDVYTKKIVL